MTGRGSTTPEAIGRRHCTPLFRPQHPYIAAKGTLARGPFLCTSRASPSEPMPLLRSYPFWQPRTIARPLAFALLAGSLLTGCFGGVVQQGIGSAASAAGEEVGEAVGAEIVRAADLPPPGSARYHRVMASQ